MQTTKRRKTFIELLLEIEVLAVGRNTRRRPRAASWLHASGEERAAVRRNQSGRSGSLVGLDREAAKPAFAVFLDRRTLNASQLEFLNLIVDHLTVRGTMDPSLLYETPFTDFDPNGVEGVFPQADVVQMMAVLREIDARSAA